MESPDAGTETLDAEPGSFRDPDSRVFCAGDGILRALSAQGLADWSALVSTRFFPRLVAEGKIVESELVESPAGLPAFLPKECTGVLRHEAVPFVSYPYEWTFGMLRDAALLQLELVLAALGEDMILKDSSPYNVQWRGVKPLFIDVGSFEKLPEGEPWVGYRQFCMLFLYPLLLQAHRGVFFQPWLRGRLDGVTPAQCRNLMSFRDIFRRGILTHVYLHARLESRGRGTAGELRRELRAAGFHKELIEANVKRLAKLIRGLEWKPKPSAWTEYGSAKPYGQGDAERKSAFVRDVATSRTWGLVWDLGCNDGRYSRIAAEGSQYVIAIDADQAVVEELYRALKAEGTSTILPLTMNIADPTPNLGWRGRERKALPERGRPELTLGLALLHHLAITENVPIGEFLEWLRGLGTAVVLEFVTKDDPMARRLLAAKRAGTHPDYERDVFERRLSEAFRLERTETLSSGTRVLYFATPKA